MTVYELVMIRTYGNEQMFDESWSSVIGIYSSKEKAIEKAKSELQRLLDEGKIYGIAEHKITGVQIGTDNMGDYTFDMVEFELDK